VSVSREITVICDICRSFCDSVGWTNEQARDLAHGEGWRRRKIDGKWLDICDACQDQQNEIECRDALAQAVSA